MFKNLFSFEGRIRRLEYALSYLIYFAGFFVVGMFIGILQIGEDSGVAKMIIVMAFIPLVWFMWSQGAKRCHDRGNSGWWQLIPFYGLIMLFGEGDSYENEYGENPKMPNAGFVDHFATETATQEYAVEPKIAQPIDDVDGDGFIKESENNSNPTGA
jgi:uncharacterized membrane protein YhaH (DUF805 family)